MALFLEVIVTSVADALEAQAGGADRLELVTALEQGGLTPSLETVAAVMGAVKLPVRVMLRERASMSLENAGELVRLQEKARQFTQLSVDGLVVGFLRDGVVDEVAMSAVAAAAPGTPITFHRAFDHASRPSDALRILKTLPQVDRVLTHGSSGSFAHRLSAISDLRKAAAPELTVIFAAGLRASDLLNHPETTDGVEIHVGRAARVPQDTAGAVSRERVAALKAVLQPC